MTDAVQLRPPPPLDATVRPPGSKSLSNRALLMAAMASGDSVLGGLLDANDTRLMRTCLRQLGVEISDHDGRTTIAGHGAALGFARGVTLHGPALGFARGAVELCGGCGTTPRLSAHLSI